jgi:hypothetical protein
MSSFVSEQAEAKSTGLLGSRVAKRARHAGSLHTAFVEDFPLG